MHKSKRKKLTAPGIQDKGGRGHPEISLEMKVKIVKNDFTKGRQVFGR